MKYADITQIEDQNLELLIIYAYGGIDDIVGVTAYAYLKKSIKEI